MAFSSIKVLILNSRKADLCQRNVALDIMLTVLHRQGVVVIQMHANTTRTRVPKLPNS